MATPIGHALMGYAIYGFNGAAQRRDRLTLIFLCIFMAIAPDLDILPGILVGHPALYHQGISHSLGFALLVSLGTAGICSLRGKTISTIFNLCFISYLSHLVIDFFGPDGRLPYGEPLFWPISAKHFISPIPVFWGMHHAPSTYSSTTQWAIGIATPYNLLAIAFEVTVLLPFAFAGKWYRRRLSKIQRTC